jgi:CheY-like chemotaxis protein
MERFLLVSVSDEGIGIPQEKREQLFQRFSRVHENKRIEGIGLGLYIAKKMIETHGGRIWLEDQSPGAKFCFTLPVLESETNPENILVVDDDVHTLRLLHRALSGMGFDILTANDGREALDKIHRFKPHLVILDVLMPIISGPELIERLRSHPETKDIRVIVFTGKSDFRLPEEHQSISVISKNLGIQTLKAEIEKVLNSQ